MSPGDLCSGGKGGVSTRRFVVDKSHSNKWPSFFVTFLSVQAFVFAMSTDRGLFVTLRQQNKAFLRTSLCNIQSPLSE